MANQKHFILSERLKLGKCLIPIPQGKLDEPEAANQLDETFYNLM